jgi:hypothetical protein
MPIERFIGPLGSLVLGQDAMMLHPNSLFIFKY